MTSEQSAPLWANFIWEAKYRSVRRIIFLRTFSCALAVCLLILCNTGKSLEGLEIHPLLIKNRLDSDDVGMVILQDSKELFSLNTSRKFKPASLSKIITGAAVLELLGPRFQFKTQLLFDGSIVDNTVRGSLYLLGGGDPSFHSAGLSVLLTGLKKQKIKKIEGDLIIDDSRFRDVVSPYWQSQIDMINPDLFPLFLRFDPPSNLAPFSPDWQKAERLHTKAVDLEGRFVVYQNMIQPNLWTGYQFQQLMQKAGIHLAGKVVRGKVSRSSKVLAEISNPLTKVVSQMMKSSNNFYADMLVRNISVAFGESPGNFGTGIDFVTFYLDHVKVPRSDYSLNSGSGFSHQNMITPRALAKLLNHLKDERTVSPYFFSSLPVAGVDGTLAGRMRKTGAQGRVHAKTGYLRPVSTGAFHLDGAVGLAGFGARRDGKNLLFVFLYNGFRPPDVVRSTFDKICVDLIGPVAVKQTKKKVALKKKVKAKTQKRKAKKS